MEKAYGIESARAKLGDIADHTRETGETVHLTRHGRTIAVIGPAQTVTPRQGVDATLLFPGWNEWSGVLPGVPHPGDQITRDTDEGEQTWAVNKVQWYLSENGTASLFVHLDPADELTRRLAARWESELRSQKKRGPRP